MYFLIVSSSSHVYFAEGSSSRNHKLNVAFGALLLIFCEISNSREEFEVGLLRLDILLCFYELVRQLLRSELVFIFH